MTKWLSLATLLFAAVASAQKPAKKPNGAGINPPWTSAAVMQPAQVAAMLKSNQPPKMFQVGFDVLYRSKHIPGSVYAGPASKPEGLENLRKAVAGVPKDSLIVLYCGCCPWDHCPNMKPAFTLLHSLGYQQIKVMEIPDNFAKDWVDKGFPVEGATASSR